MTQNDYEVKVSYSWKNISAREKIALKNFNTCESLDELLDGENNVEIDVENYIVCDVHNIKAEGDKKDYKKYVIVDKSGTKYATGSPTFFRELTDIVSELEDSGEEGATDNIVIRAYKRDSKNYKGKQFITCSLV